MRGPEEAWRFYTIPGPGEPGNETWPARLVEATAARSWVTGSYDPQSESHLLGASAIPGPDWNLSQRKVPTSIPIGAGSRCRHRQTEVAFSVHPARSLRLRLDSGPGSGGRAMGRPHAQTDAVGQSQRLLLCALTGTNGQFLSGHPFVKVRPGPAVWMTTEGLLRHTEPPGSAGLSRRTGWYDWYSPFLQPVNRPLRCFPRGTTTLPFS